MESSNEDRQWHSFLGILANTLRRLDGKEVNLPSEQKAILEKTNRAENELQELLKAQAIAPPGERDTLEMEILRNKTTAYLLYMKFSRGVIRRNFEMIQKLEKGIRELIDKNDGETKVLQRQVDQINRDKQVAENLEKMSQDCLREAVERLDEKSELMKALEARVATLTDDLKEKDLELRRKLEAKDLEMGRKLKEKDFLVERHRKKLAAEKSQLEEWHKRECDSLRLEAQRKKDLEGSYLGRFLETSLEALREAGVIPQTPSQKNSSDGQQDAGRDRLVKLAGNIETGREGVAAQIETGVQTPVQTEQNKRSRETAVEAVARNVSELELGEITLGLGRKTRRRLLKQESGEGA